MALAFPPADGGVTSGSAGRPAGGLALEIALFLVRLSQRTSYSARSRQCGQLKDARFVSCFSLKKSRSFMMKAEFRIRNSELKTPSLVSQFYFISALSGALALSVMKHDA